MKAEIKYLIWIRYKKIYSYNPQKIRCIIEYEEKKIGYLQYYNLDEEDINLYLDSDCKDVCYGVDLFIGEPNYWNKGIGTENEESYWIFS